MGPNRGLGCRILDVITSPDVGAPKMANGGPPRFGSSEGSGRSRFLGDHGGVATDPPAIRGPPFGS